MGQKLESWRLLLLHSMAGIQPAHATVAGTSLYGKGDWRHMPSEEVMSEFKRGKLRSGSKKGRKVKSRKQAIAIMLSERRKEGKGARRGKKARA